MLNNGNPDHQELSDTDFVTVDPLYSGSAYTPFQVNVMLYGMFQELIAKKWLVAEPRDEYSEMKPEESEIRAEELFTIFTNQDHERIAVVKVARDNPCYAPFYGGSSVIPLDRVLKFFINNQLSFEKIIIPIAQLVRGHFRLLVIRPNESVAHFFDSKAFLVSHVSEILASTWVSLVSVLVHLAEAETYSLSEIGSLTSTSFNNTYRYIQNTCGRYFPGMTVSIETLGHQDMSNHVDCGPFMIEYIRWQLVGGASPFQGKFNMPSIREHHEALFQKYSSDYLNHVNTLKTIPHKPAAPPPVSIASAFPPRELDNSGSIQNKSSTSTSIMPQPTFRKVTAADLGISFRRKPKSVFFPANRCPPSKVPKSKDVTKSVKWSKRNG